jgi:hypothetical protein
MWRALTHYLAQADFRQIVVLSAMACAVGIVCLLGFGWRSK